MGFKLNRESQPQVVSRIEHLAPDSERHWGKLTPIEMLAHLTMFFEIALGEIEVEDQSTFFSRTIMPHIILLMPWPKGKIKVPDTFIPEPEGDFEAERAKVLAAMERFIEATEREPNRRVQNPFLGLRPLKFHRGLYGKHMDHHLQQFGV